VFDVDLVRLEATYKALQRRLHPDKYSTASPVRSFCPLLAEAAKFPPGIACPGQYDFQSKCYFAMLSEALVSINWLGSRAVFGQRTAGGEGVFGGPVSAGQHRVHHAAAAAQARHLPGAPSMLRAILSVHQGSGQTRGVDVHLLSTGVQAV
jgi:hypothetical protein